MNLSDVTRKAAAALSFNWHLLDRSFLSFFNMAPSRVEFGK